MSGTLGIIFHDSLDGPWEQAAGHLKEELEQLRLGLQTLMNASSSSASSSSSSSGAVRSKKVTLSNSQILTLPTTPVTLIDAPGVGKRLVFLYADLEGDFTAGAYSSVSYLGGYWYVNLANEEMQYSSYLNNDSTYTPNITELGGFLGNASLNRAALVPFTWADGTINTGWGNFAKHDTFTTTSQNQPMNLIAGNDAVGNYTGGDSANSLTINLLYAII